MSECSQSALGVVSSGISKLFILGWACKANIDDQHESPSFALMDFLSQAGATVDYHYSFIPVIKLTREHATWTGLLSVSWDQATVSTYDVVIISAAHPAVDYAQLAQWVQVIVDTCNAMASIPLSDRAKVWKA